MLVQFVISEEILVYALNSHENNTKIFKFNKPENVMRGYHIQNGSCCQFVVCKSDLLGKINDVACEKMHFTWFSRKRWVLPHLSSNPALGMIR